MINPLIKRTLGVIAGLLNNIIIRMIVKPLLLICLLIGGLTMAAIGTGFVSAENFQRLTPVAEVAAVLVLMIGFGRLMSKFSHIALVPANVYVIDGDTLSVKIRGNAGEEKLRVRIAGYDAPEKCQMFGDEATVELRQAIKTAGGITVNPIDVDKWGRAVAEVRLGIKGNKGNVARHMIAEGLGHPDTQNLLLRYLITLPARIKGKGMWHGNILVRLMGLGVISPKAHRAMRSR